MQAYPAYCNNGRIIPIGNPFIPNGSNLIITVLDEKMFTSIDTSKNDRMALWEEVKKLHGIVRPDIDEKTELAKARDEKYGRLS
ncbi:MAG: hypothetical protein FWG70_09145 [Oscillospiraceae bacterium]|nr:hypothetical protein [Oscillospiraceae bacterium]